MTISYRNPIIIWSLYHMYTGLPATVLDDSQIKNCIVVSID